MLADSALLFPQIFSALSSESVFLKSYNLEVNREEFSVVVDSFLPIPLNVLSKGAVRQTPPFYAGFSLTKCKGWYFGLATVEFLKVKGAS